MKFLKALLSLAVILGSLSQGQATPPADLENRIHQHTQRVTAIVCSSDLPPEMQKALMYTKPNEPILGISVTPEGMGFMDVRLQLLNQLRSTPDFSHMEKITLLREIFNYHRCGCTVKRLTDAYGSAFTEILTAQPRNLRAAGDLMTTSLDQTEAMVAANTYMATYNKLEAENRLAHTTLESTEANRLNEAIISALAWNSIPNPGANS